MRHRRLLLAGVVGLNALSWGALYLYGVRPPTIGFEPIGPGCRNIPISVDDEIWQTADAVPTDGGNYELAFDDRGDEGTLTMTDRNEPEIVIELAYERTGGFVNMPCRAGGN